jgi:hypothetical protein
MLSPLPRHRDWGHCLAHSPSPVSLPRNGGQVGLCNVLFEACSAFTRVTACTLAGSSKMTRYIRGSSHFVTSMTAPIASGWNKFAGWALHPLRNAAFARRTPNDALCTSGRCLCQAGIKHSPGIASIGSFQRGVSRVTWYKGADFCMARNRIPEVYLLYFRNPVCPES